MEFILAHKLEILSVLVVFEQVLPTLSFIPGNSTLQLLLEVAKKAISAVKKSE